VFEFLFLDLDDTILDFHKAEHLALGKTFRGFGLEPTEEVMARYSQINKAHWERLERKELTREEVLVGRFAVLFHEFGLEVDPVLCARTYENNLSVGHYFLPGAQEALQSLSKKYKLYLASNGTSRVQWPRLESSGIGKYFQDIFISQDMGADKPSLAYFNSCFARIPGFDVSRAMMVGDSLTSDIRGGINTGMRTCWVNPGHKKGREDIPADYEIESLGQLEALLEQL
jgi:2-haloacid dehalogenase